MDILHYWPVKLRKNVGGLHLSETIFTMLQLQSTPVTSCGDTWRYTWHPIPNAPSIAGPLRWLSRNSWGIGASARSLGQSIRPASNQAEINGEFTVSCIIHPHRPNQIHQGCPHLFEDKLNSQLLEPSRQDAIKIIPKTQKTVVHLCPFEISHPIGSNWAISVPSQPGASWIAFQKSCPPHSAVATPQALRKSSAMDKDGSWRRTCTTDSEKNSKRNTQYDSIWNRYIYIYL